MNGVWFGVQVAIGLAVGAVGIIALVWLFFTARYVWIVRRFSREGCSYQPRDFPGAPSGWLIRDMRNNDWVLWDEKNWIALRVADEAPAGEKWETSKETLQEFLALARHERQFWSEPASTAGSTDE